MSIKEIFETSFVNMQNGINKHLTNLLIDNNFLQPEMDVLESSENFYIILNLPGICKKSIDIIIKDNEVCISGQKKFPIELNKIKFLSREIIYGNFKRKFKLPVTITDKKSVTTEFKDGILTIKIDKKSSKSNYFSIRVHD